MEQKLEERLVMAGIDCVEGVIRMDGSEKMFMKYLLKFPSDKNYQEMLESVEEQRWEDASIYAHALKGLCANLGMKELQADCQQAEDDTLNRMAPRNMEELRERYNAILDTIAGIAEA